MVTGQHVHELENVFELAEVSSVKLGGVFGEHLFEHSLVLVSEVDFVWRKHLNVLHALVLFRKPVNAECFSIREFFFRWQPEGSVLHEEVKCEAELSKLVLLKLVKGEVSRVKVVDLLDVLNSQLDSWATVRFNLWHLPDVVSKICPLTNDLKGIRLLLVPDN
jgi:hypothetical protein